MKLLYGSWEMLLEINSLSSLWFLPVLFLASAFSELILWTLHKLKRQKCIILLLSILLLIIGCHVPHNSNYGWPLGFDIAIVATAFMLIGFLIKSYMVILTKSKYTNFLVLMGSVSTFLILNKKYIITVNMCEAYYENIFLFVIYALLGAIAVLAAAILIETCSLPCRVLSYVGQSTLGILVVHKPIVRYGKTIISEMNLSGNNIIVALCVVALAGELISIIITALIGKISPVIVGKASG